MKKSATSSTKVSWTTFGHNGVEFYVEHGVMYREETGEPRNVYETEKDAGRQQQDLSIVETEAFADFFWTTN